MVLNSVPTVGAMALASDPKSTQLAQLADYLAGEFDNRQQSLADPLWYLHLRVWNRPLPSTLFNDGHSFFIEQVSVASGQEPYRQRILHIAQRDHQLWGQYYGLKEPLAFRGGATQPERLTALDQGQLIALPTCGLAIEIDAAAQTFVARPPEGTLCRFTYGENTGYVRLGFDIGPDPSGGPVMLKVYDRGMDPDTGKATWGPQMGPFHLVKQRGF
jgi:hypothetical protein